MTEIEYTIEEGKEWISARVQEEQFLETVEQWADDRELKVDPERRISIEVEGGNVVPAAAIRFGDGRVLDAILGCFRDDEEALNEIIGASTDALGPEQRAVVEMLKERSVNVQAYLEGEGPDPIPTDENDDA